MQTFPQSNHSVLSLRQRDASTAFIIKHIMEKLRLLKLTPSPSPYNNRSGPVNECTNVESTKLV